MARGVKRFPDLVAYAGKWVAFSDRRVVATGSSLSEVMRKLPASRAASRSKPSVFLVPRRDEGPYVLALIFPAC